MPSNQEIRQGQELIRRFASDQDPNGAWTSKIQATGVIDPVTISASQVLLYLAEKIKPLPAGLHPLLQPGTPTLWKATASDNWQDMITYFKASFRRGLTRDAVIAIGFTVAVAAAFLIGVKKLADWQDKQALLREGADDGDE